jgi:hypothetical protein
VIIHPLGKGGLRFEFHRVPPLAVTHESL